MPTGFRSRRRPFKSGHSARPGCLGLAAEPSAMPPRSWPVTRRQASSTSRARPGQPYAAAVHRAANDSRRPSRGPQETRLIAAASALGLRGLPAARSRRRPPGPLCHSIWATTGRPAAIASIEADAQGGRIVPEADPWDFCAVVGIGAWLAGGGPGGAVATWQRVPERATPELGPVIAPSRGVTKVAAVGTRSGLAASFVPLLGGVPDRGSASRVPVAFPGRFRWWFRTVCSPPPCRCSSGRVWLFTPMFLAPSTPDGEGQPCGRSPRAAGPVTHPSRSRVPRGKGEML